MNAPLWFQNLAAYGLQIAILVTAGTLLPLALRIRHPRVLLAYWQVMLAACLLLPALQPWKRLATRPMVSLEAGAIRIGGTLSQTRARLATCLFTQRRRSRSWRASPRGWFGRRSASSRRLENPTLRHCSISPAALPHRESCPRLCS